MLDDLTLICDSGSGLNPQNLFVIMFCSYIRCAIGHIIEQNIVDVMLSSHK